jgi:hypothetical protein
MDKDHIIAEIQRTAAANDGQPLGSGRFEKETGIKRYDWYGKYWARWSDAITEAGLPPNEFTKPFNDEFLIETLANLVRELGRFPVEAELQMRSRSEPSFPNYRVFSRLGRKAELAAKVIDFCNSRGCLEDVAEICRPVTIEPKPELVDNDCDGRDDEQFGHVYLFKSGKYYKIRPLEFRRMARVRIVDSITGALDDCSHNFNR